MKGRCCRPLHGPPSGRDFNRHRRQRTEDQAIAALLHDAPEDQGGEATLEEIRVKFGDNVAGIVKDLSDTLEDPKPPWKKRKESYLDHLQTVSDSTLLVSLADKLHNVQSIALDREQVGEKVWDRFTCKRDGSLWYYRALGEIYGERMADSPLLRRYLRDSGRPGDGRPRPSRDRIRFVTRGAGQGPQGIRA